MLNIYEEIEKLEYPSLPVRSEEEIKKLSKDLLEKMTLDEKIGQLFQSAPPTADIQGLEWERDYDANELIKGGKVGSILSMTDPTESYKLQKLAVEESRLGIPLFFGVDIIHGCRTIFPVNLAMACSFDPEFVKKSCEAIGMESSKTGVTMTYSPMVDLVRDPRWGRVMESNGEDPYLNTLLAKAYVEGFQREELTSYDSVAACGKHFAAYGAGEAGKEYNTVDMSEGRLRQYYLPGYKACKDAGVAAFMTAFNIVDGIPSTANKKLLRDILRDEWNYDGFVISDYTSTYEMIDHKYATDERDVAKKSILAGLDHEMVSMSYMEQLKGLIEDGEVEERLVDEAALRILEFKYKVGLFDNPYKNIWNNSESFMLTEKTRETAREMSKKSSVLLKNNGILPLKDKKIALIGPFAESNEVMGPWSGLGKNEECVTLLEGLKKEYAGEIKTAKGCNIEGADRSGFAEAIKIAEESDVVILAMGESQEMSGEASSRAYLHIPGIQNELAREIKKTGKPVVLVSFSGRPIELNWHEENMDAILHVWFLGTESGNAIAELLSGKTSPSGKLAMTFPQTVGQVPIYYNEFNTGRPSLTGGPKDTYRSGYIDVSNDPLYPFGYGLSYGKFEYSDLKILKKNYVSGEDIEVSFRLKNIGELEGEETIQLYIGCESFSVVRPLKELKRINKVSLLPNEEKLVTLNLSEEDLAYYNSEMKFVAETSRYNIFVGGNSKDTLKTSLNFKKTGK